MNREELMRSCCPTGTGCSCWTSVEQEGDDAPTGSYHVRGDEWFLQGHFPGNPRGPRRDALRDPGAVRLQFCWRKR